MSYPFLGPHGRGPLVTRSVSEVGRVIDHFKVGPKRCRVDTLELVL